MSNQIHHTGGDAEEAAISSVPLILLVDDTPANLHLLIGELGQAHYRVLVAESGESALERVRYVQPDIILLDVLMPGLDGFETCRLLKANPATSQIPVLFLSALDETVDKVRGFAVGGVDYITKPLQVIEVLARLRTHVTLRNLQQALQRQNESLEERVAERTAQLRAEIELRIQREKQKHQLLDLLEQQSDQLRELTGWLLKENQAHQQNRQQRNTSYLLELLQQSHHQLGIIEMLAIAHPNSTERYQLLTQVEHLRTIVQQVESELRPTPVEIQPPPTIRKTLEDPLLALSAREREVFQLMIDGRSVSQIAALLYLSEITVRSHRSSLLQKLQLEDITALIKFAVKHNLTTV